jgi:hypothetical protein
MKEPKRLQIRVLNQGRRDAYERAAREAGLTLTDWVRTVLDTHADHSDELEVRAKIGGAK